LQRRQTSSHERHARYRRDITVRQALGSVLVVRLLEKPVFRAEFDAAHAELQAAGLTE
jgi:hypothetical protein